MTFMHSILTHREHFFIRYVIPHTQNKVNFLAFFQYFLYNVSFVSLTWNHCKCKSVIENLLYYDGIEQKEIGHK